MRLLTVAILATASLLIFSGCGGITPKPKDEVVIDDTLPVIELTHSGVIADMNSIAFEWRSIKDPRVKGIYIYKDVLSGKHADEARGNFYKTIQNRFQTHFLDKEITPDTKYNYIFKTFSANAESKPSKTVSITSLPVLKSVSWIQSITGMPRSAKILWRPHSNKKVESYIIERSTLSDPEWDELDRVDGRLNAEYIDTDLKDSTVYKYRVRVKTFDGIISTPSRVVKVVTKPLPQEVQNIHATTNLPKQIKLTWNRSTAKDFMHYNVYRSKDVNGHYSVIAQLKENSYSDKIQEDGKQYFYRVSVVDKDGLESHYDKYSIQGITLAKPNAPAIVEAKLINGRIEISWKEIDQRTVRYMVNRVYKKSFFDKESHDYKGITSQRMVDKNIVAGGTYYYKVYAVDKYGVQSKPSMEVTVEVPESQRIEVQEDVQPQKEVVVTPSNENGVVVHSQNLDLNGL